MGRIQSLVVALSLVFAANSAAETRTPIPTIYEAGHFYAKPVTTSGQPLRLLVDTGGAGFNGYAVLYASTVARLKLTTAKCDHGDMQATIVPRLDFQPGKSLPLEDHAYCPAVAMVIDDPTLIKTDDGIMGGGNFPGHIWTFDYHKRQLWLESHDWTPTKSAKAAALGFMRNDDGTPGSPFARIEIKVDGEIFSMLLDTGATAMPSSAGAQASGTETVNGVGVTSYIVSSTIDRWHARHPTWRMIDGGDILFAKHPMRTIEVPAVEIAGWTVGPVWFTERADPAFHKFMSQYMDKQVEGAVGGNVYAHFAMTVDYPKAKAWFDCKVGCAAAASK